MDRRELDTLVSNLNSKLVIVDIQSYCVVKNVFYVLNVCYIACNVCLNAAVGVWQFAIAYCDTETFSTMDRACWASEHLSPTILIVFLIVVTCLAICRRLSCSEIL